MTRQPWMKFYPSDWQSDLGLRSCSAAARGVWMELICIMQQARPVGYLTINGAAPSDALLATLCGLPEKVVRLGMAELLVAGVYGVDEKGVVFSRRLIRDADKAARDKANGGKGGGNPTIRRGTVPKEERVRPFKRSDAPAKTERVFRKSEGSCYWCSSTLSFSDFHIDHLLPVCDGGTNDEDNLVAACAVCNHDRSKTDWPLNSRRGVDPTATAKIDPTLTHVRQSDSKAHIPEPRSQRKTPVQNRDLSVDHSREGGR